MAGREQQIKEQVALVAAPLTVAAPRPQRHQIELRRPLRGGKGAVVQSDDADDAEGQAAQAAHRRKRDAARGHAAARRVIELLLERAAQHRHWQRRRVGVVKAAALQGVAQRADCRQQLALIVELVVDRGHEGLDHFEQQVPPGQRRARDGDCGLQGPQAVDKLLQGAQRQRVSTLGVAGRQQMDEGLRGLGGQCITQEQAVQAVGPGVAGGARHTKAGAVRAIQCPPDA